ncbi:hypothetical protein [Pelagovum pacificum]|uniref:Succinate dehydrogenase n=1 Tax=Pelagovum pacificum TaxID=2588711 RepID=A0A5C5GA20_9RHOB|nr:hypothetical protein [Pelagovum pacificum]QQA42438.1 hypothetical protein I8N54_16855 [Pelagovum pacificum]TNY31521.1 hypothetical protein FHY64_16045 [Pelagovum pacificum]
MTLRLPLLIAAFAGLAACSDGVPMSNPVSTAPVATGPAPATPAEAREVVVPVVSAQVPGELGGAVSDCVIDNASQDEINRIAETNAASPSPDVVLLIADILSRPATTACATAA